MSYVTVFRENHPRWTAATRTGDVIARRVVAPSGASADEARAAAELEFPGRTVFVLPDDREAFAEHLGGAS